MSRTCRWITLVIILGMVVAVGCSRSPEAKKARHLERGDRFFSQQQYREAIIEYRNVLRFDGANAHAFQQIGFSYYQLGELGQAFPFLLRAKALDPNNLVARLKLGTIYLLGQKLEETREEATFVPEREPKNFEALLLSALTAATAEEIDTALKRLEAVQADFGDRAKFHIARGTLYLRQQNPTSAEQAYKEAVAREPESVEAHTLLGNFYLGQRNLPLAEQEFQAAARPAPLDSQAQIQLADFYVLLRKTEQAKEVLEAILRQKNGYLPAWRRLAQIQLGEGNIEEALKTVETILKKSPSDGSSPLR